MAFCQTLSGPAEPIAPKAPDARICAPALAEPSLPPAAGIVQPATPPEQDATSAFLVWVQTALDWGRQGWAKAEIARKADCGA